ncbi:MAG: TetR/AcrR family transcriptional regulator [Candidatus Binatia bacterium]|nr:TetR/AcrR family transcriptional regulator [Candidatus Binatia bacterium]
MTEDARSGRELWLEAGQELLRRGGIVSVKLQALTDEIGLTTGSFYHHFNGMKDYLDQLARFYGADQVRKNLFTVNDADPRMRLRKLGAMAIKDRMVPLDAAMRDWAGSNRIAAASVRAADEHLMRFIAKAFRNLGYPRREAQVRAQLLQSVGVARVMPPWKTLAGDTGLVLKILAP